MRTHSLRTPRRGVILYHGPSLIDGGPIVAIATGFGDPSANPKTGPMLQAFILRADIPPLAALMCGKDTSVCGQCPHRRAHRGTCYVNVGQSPTSVWNAFRRGSYDPMSPEVLEAFRGRSVRIGAYGDPAAVPLAVWRPIARLASRWTGYTHQWRTCAPGFRGLVMASCDSSTDRTEAIARGWRTFRVRAAGEPMEPREFVCPASDEGGKRVTCDRCGACNGTRLDERAHAVCPVIIAHGARARRF